MSIGFCVATTMNGRGIGYTIASLLSVPSSITSSSADWVFGEARLISSPSTMLAKTGPCLNSNSLVALVVDRHAGDVGGQQVGRELDAVPRDRQRGRQRAGQRGLAGAGHVLEQQVALGEQADDRVVDHLGLALDDVADVRAQPLDVAGDLRDRLRTSWSCCSYIGRGRVLASRHAAVTRRCRRGCRCGVPYTASIWTVSGLRRRDRRLVIRDDRRVTHGGRGATCRTLRSPVSIDLRDRRRGRQARRTPEPWSCVEVTTVQFHVSNSRRGRSCRWLNADVDDRRGAVPHAAVKLCVDTCTGVARARSPLSVYAVRCGCCECHGLCS